MTSTARPQLQSDPSRVALRRVPYPYSAMLAVANDIDCASWGDFVELHRYMNGTGPTSLGDGLGLEVADSFFLFTVGRQSGDGAFAYFDDLDGAVPSKHAPALDRLIAAGYVDSLHSWGNFSRVGGFARRHAEIGLEVLRSQRRAIRVWINHGDEHNRQRAGLPGWDDPTHAAGHADLADEGGIRWVWTGTLTDTIGQSAQRPRRASWSRLKNDYLRPARRLLARENLGGSFHGNELTSPLRARVGSFREFLRFGHWDRAVSDDFSEVLSDRVLDELERARGFMVAYTHFYRRRSAADLAAVDWSGLGRLVERERLGRIKTTTTERLLAYHDMTRGIRHHVTRRNGHVDIDADTHGMGAVRREDLRGLTFYTPDPERTRLRVDGREVEVERHEPDETGHPSVGVAWDALRFDGVLG